MLTRSLSVQVCGLGLLLPPKKLIGNMDRDFIAERQRGLQAYLDSVTQHPLLSCSLPVKKFLDPNSYSANYTGTIALSPLQAGSHRVQPCLLQCLLFFKGEQ